MFEFHRISRHTKNFFEGYIGSNHLYIITIQLLYFVDIPQTVLFDFIENSFDNKLLSEWSRKIWSRVSWSRIL